MTAEEKVMRKSVLKAAAQAIIEQRIAAVKNVIAEAQLAANAEEKSSAGDKYETSRAMGHLEKDMQSRQLAAHLKELAALHAVNINNVYMSPVPGSFVESGTASFFIGCGLGKQSVNGQSIVFLSSHAPLAISLAGKKPGDSFVFNGTTMEITAIY